MFSGRRQATTLSLLAILAAGIPLKSDLLLAAQIDAEIDRAGSVSRDARPTDPGPSRTDASSADLESLKRLIRDAHYQEAEKLARQIVQRDSTETARESPEAAEGLRYLVDALLRQAKERDPETRRLADESVSLSRRVFGETHPNYAASLENLGALLLRMDDFDGARTAYQAGLAINKEAFGPTSPEAALTMNKLAAVEGITGHLHEAGALMEQAVSIVDGLGTVDNPDLANILHNYGTYLDNSGDILGRENANRRALEIRERTLPTPHPQIAYSLMALGNAREKLGDYASARELLEKSLAMTEQTLGPNHRQVATALSNLAQLLADTGRPDLGIPYQERSLAITRAGRGEDNSIYAQELSELGMYRARAGDWEGALNILRSALTAQEKKFGTIHQEVGATLLRLAGVEAASGDADSATEHYQRAIQTYRQVFGPSHPQIAVGLDGLAHLKYSAGDFDGAGGLFRQAQELRENSLGANHPDVAEGLVELARVEWAQGDARGALKESLQAEAILRDHFGSVIRGFSEREALAFQRIRATGLGVAFSVLAGTPPSERPAGSVEEVWNAALRSRAIVLDQIASRHEFAAEHRTGRPAALATALAAAANRLARLVVQGPDPQHPQDYREKFEQALAAKEKLEHDLAEATDGSSGFPAAADISLKGIRSILPQRTGLVAFIQFSTSLGATGKLAGSTRAAQGISGAEYGALVLTTNHSNPAFFDLGSVAEIDSLISRWRREMAPPVSGSLHGGSPAERRYRQAGARLRMKLWDPLAGRLAESKQVLIVPEGNIALVNFAVLPIRNDRYLLEESPVLHYLTTERDILKPVESRVNGTRFLVMGAPDFDMSPPLAAASLEKSNPLAAASTASSATVASYRGIMPGCADFRDLRFESIPGAANEVVQVENHLLAGGPSNPWGKSTVADFTGPRASEPSFKRWAPGSAVLHLATHGFFLGAGCDNVLAGAGRSVPGQTTHESLFHEAIFLGNPFLLSGLALSGANQRSLASADGDDGILTSEEIASLDLSSARWVVLSACETGIGEIQTGEGVLGLRRAFQLAGARTVIMSLWKVEDQATLEWMRKLYEGREKGLSTAEAVQGASLTVLLERRAKGKSTLPFYWGAFVSAGDWR